MINITAQAWETSKECFETRYNIFATVGDVTRVARDSSGGFRERALPLPSPASRVSQLVSVDLEGAVKIRDQAAA